MIFAKLSLKALKDQQMIVKIDKRAPKGVTRPDLRIFLSLNHREPTETNCERVI